MISWTEMITPHEETLTLHVYGDGSEGSPCRACWHGQDCQEREALTQTQDAAVAAWQAEQVASLKTLSGAKRDGLLY